MSSVSLRSSPFYSLPRSAYRAPLDRMLQDSSEIKNLARSWSVDHERMTRVSFAFFIRQLIRSSVSPSNFFSRAIRFCDVAQDGKKREVSTGEGT